MPFACTHFPFGDPPQSIDGFRIFANDIDNQSDNGILKELGKVIDSGTLTLDCAFSRLTRADIANALIAKARAGVTVRLAMDVDAADGEAVVQSIKDSGHFSTEFDLKKGSKLLLGNKGDGTLRYNFCVADSRRIFLSTAAPDDLDLTQLPNVAIIMGSEEFGISREFTKELNQMSQGGFGSRKSKLDFDTKFSILNQAIAVHWGPQENPMDVIAAEIIDAKKSIRLYTSLFQKTSTKSALDIPQVLRRRIDRNIDVKIVSSSQAIFDNNSKLSTFQSTGASLRQYINPKNRIGLNILVIDAGTVDERFILYTGALRSRANSSDDGVLLILKGSLATNFGNQIIDFLQNKSDPVEITPTPGVAGAVVINEINYMGSYENSGGTQSRDEYVELYNTTSQSINLSGWKFACKSGSSSINSLVKIPTGVIIKPAQTVLFSRYNNRAVETPLFLASVSITNSSNECQLRDADGTNAPVYGSADFNGKLVDRAGDGSTSFSSASNMGLNDSSNKIRRSMERIEPTAAGNDLTNWKTNAYSNTNNPYISPGFRQRTFGSPGSENFPLEKSLTLSKKLSIGTTSASEITVTVEDKTANQNRTSADTVSVSVSSTNDSTGITINLTETNVNTATFDNRSAKLQFSNTASAANTIRVSNGDTVTLTYTSGSDQFTKKVIWLESPFLINEIGISSGSNDFVEVYNPHSFEIDLGDLDIYLHRDSSCNLTNGITQSIPLTGKLNRYYTVANAGHSLANINQNNLGNISVGYCLFLTVSNKTITNTNDASIIDFVTVAGSGSDKYGKAPSTGSNGAISRLPDGQNTGNHSTDFKKIPATPGAVNGAPTYTSTPASGATGVLANANIVLTFSATMNTSSGTVNVSGNTSGAQNSLVCAWSTSSNTNDTCTINPPTDFATTGESVSVTLNDFKENVNALSPLPSTFSFTTANLALIPSVTNVVVLSTSPNNSTTPFNTGSTNIRITGNRFSSVTCPSGVKLNDPGNTVAASCTVDSNTQITATLPAGIRTNGTTGWDVLVTNSNGSNANSSVKFIPKAGILITEVGDRYSSTTANDYIEIYNVTAHSINLSSYRWMRDSGCNLSNGWTQSNATFSTSTINAHSYFLISRSSNTISADISTMGNLSNNYCVAITSGGAAPSSAAASNIIDFVAFGTSITDSENSSIAPAISAGRSIRRNGTCKSTDSDQNSSDFTLITSPSAPKNSGSPACTP